MGLVRSAATGLALTLATVAGVGFGAWRLANDAQRGAEAQATRAPVERVFAVNAARFAPTTYAPVIEAFGEVVAARSLRVSAGVRGRVAALAPEFRDGGRVAAGALLLRIDEADLAAALAEAENALAAARAEAAEARQSVRSAELERAAAGAQLALRRAGLDRQRGLAARGVAPQASVDEAELALAAAEQSAASRAQALLTAELRVPRADLSVERAALAASEAARMLGEAVLVAPFAGVLAETAAQPGDLVAAGAPLGLLIDLDALEVAFQVTNAEYARLLDEAGALRPLAASVRLALGEAAAEAPARLAREGAVIAAGRTGRTLFASIEPGAAPALRPGDFVAVRVTEPPLAGVAVIPAAAATEDGRVLLIDGDDRLRETRLRILRREGAALVVEGAPAGAAYVAARSALLGPGVRVRPSFAAEAGSPAAAAAPGPGAPARDAPG